MHRRTASIVGCASVDAPLSESDPQLADALAKDCFAGNRLEEKIAFLGNKPALPLLRRHFEKQGTLSERAALRLLSEARQVQECEPNVAVVDNAGREVLVVGDLHGQYHDLLLIMDQEGMPRPGKAAVFLGDYINRGKFSTETILYLCACKVLWPDSFTLLRGNHECRLMAARFGFWEECMAKYSAPVFDAFISFFESMPVAAVITHTRNGTCFCCHGGIGPSYSTLDDINRANRFVEVPDRGVLNDLLWSDPLPEWSPTLPSEFDDIWVDEWDEVRFVRNHDRNTSFFYGHAAVESFLQRNHLCCIIRGHQVQETGFQAHFAQGVTFPRVLTVFSAPNYCDCYANVSAYLIISDQGFRMQQNREVSHPAVLPGYADPFTHTFPAITQSVMAILRALVKGTDSERIEGLSDQERKWDEQLEGKIQKMYEKAEKMKTLHDEMMTVSAPPENVSKFERMILEDKHNEMRPNGSPAPRVPLLARKSAGALGSMREAACLRRWSSVTENLCQHLGTLADDSPEN